MIELLKTQMGLIDIPVRIQFMNGKLAYGVLVDHLENKEVNISDWKFVSNLNLQKFRETESPKFIEKLNESRIASVDMLLK